MKCDKCRGACKIMLPSAEEKKCPACNGSGYQSAGVAVVTVVPVVKRGRKKRG